MSLATLMTVGIGIFIVVLITTLVTVNRAYKYEHTIDEHPNQQSKPS